MYNPSRFKSNDQGQAFQLMNSYPYKIGILKGLEARTDEQSHQVLSDMKNLK